MPLTPTTRLGPYEIVAPLGAGGMGEVYRARDTRLERDVAIKVLPQHLSENPEIRARFEREAKTVSSLNHPHICTLFDVGRENGIDYLVMELVEGETLAARLTRGPLPAAEVLKLGAQIADALDRAHRAGVVHRDLKPGNVMLTRGGAKLMDFGLARAIGLAGPDGPSGITHAALTQSPTMASPLTAEGTIVGTFQYMSPEQLEGREADGRSDVWAFGCVLYEMATGRRAFEGRSQASLISAIMSSQPPSVSQVAPLAPPGLDRLVRTCLMKDPDERARSAHDLKLQLQGLQEAGSQSMAAAPAIQRPARSASLAWIVAAVATIAALAMAIVLATRDRGPRAPVHFSIEPAAHQTLQPNAVSMAISPDGRSIAYTAADTNGAPALWVRRLDSPTAKLLAPANLAAILFWSPDSRSLGFLADGKLKKVEVAGGVPTTLCDVPSTFGGGTWGTGGTIVFSSLSQQGSFTLKRMPSAGGEPAEVWSGLDVGESRIRPSFLPDGRHLLYASVAIGQVASQSVPIYLGALDSAKRVQAVVSGSTNVQYAQGHLLFLREAALMAQPFDLDRLTTTGGAIVVADKIQRQGVQPPYGLFSASANGVLVYQTGTNAGAGGMQLAWVDRKGVLLERVGELANYSSVALSPNGTQAVVGETVPLPDLWTFDLRRSVKTRLTFGSSTVLFPTWSPDGSRIAFGRSSAGVNILLKAANGSGGEEPALPPGREAQTPNDWSPDGRYLLYEKGVGSRADIWILPMAGDRTPVPFVVTSFRDGRARFSPDGRWVAYGSDESGRTEVYVTPFTAPESASAPGGAEGAVRRARQQVSPGGGDFIRWSRDGREIFYVSSPPNPSLMVVEVSAGEGGLMIGAVTKMFSLSYPSSNQGWFYDVAPDGQRFLMVVPQQLKLEGPPAMPTVVLNWAPSRAQ